MSELDALLPILCCPVTRQALRRATPAEVARLVDRPAAEGWLITEDGRRAYPVRERIPQLVPEEGVELPQSAS
ncbi:MAG: hypothetical protein JSR82_22905 [Verrucomicrobia bacterium]|nr:hypothetical protein [Verrucomicrobiota bacterium]